MKNKFACALAAMLCLAPAAVMAGCADGNGGTADHSFTVADVYAWLGDYPESEITAVFKDPANAEDISFEYDTTKITVSANNTVKALIAGEVEVKAYTQNYQTTFKVYCEEVDKSYRTYNLNQGSPLWSIRKQNFESKWAMEGNAGKTTIFIGDSFFDASGFWKNFYSEYYPGKDALCWGIGSTTSYTWETMTEVMFANPNIGIVPKNIVVNVGTNNVYDQNATTEETVSSLQRLYTMLHSLYPQTKIYYFNITHRMYDDAEMRYPIVNGINAQMKEWCNGKDWITFVDISDKIKFNDLMGDAIHPKLETYRYFTQALEECGIEIEDL